MNHSEISRAVVGIVDDGIGGKTPSAQGRHCAHLVRVALDDWAMGPVNVGYIRHLVLLVSHLQSRIASLIDASILDHKFHLGPVGQVGDLPVEVA